MEVTYTYKGDEIIKQKSVNTLKYSDFSPNDDTSKKIMKEAIEKESKKMQDVKGVKETVKENDEGIVETITIDLKNADIDTLKSKDIVSMSGNTGNGFSMKKTEKEIYFIHLE